MAEFVFAPATKAQEKARIALEGPSGSGKTWSALSIAQGLGQRIAVIDTERGSASKYASDFTFDVCKLFAFDPRDLVKALALAAAYDVVIVDSLSHFWMGAGGMLEQVDAFAKRSNSGNSFAAWKDARPLEREMIDALLAFPGHVIVTMRTKTEWVITENDRGRKEPKKIGLKAEQRDGIEYEFDLVGALDLDHNLVVSKSRMSVMADQVIARPDIEVGRRILEWLSDGVKLPTVADYLEQLAVATDPEQVRGMYREVVGRNLSAAPCLDPDGAPATLLGRIMARGAQLGGGQVAPAQPAMAADKMQRSKGAPEDDPWATQPEGTYNPSAAEPPAQPPADERPRANKTLLRSLAIEAKKHAKTDEERYALIGRIIGREITTTDGLSVDEATNALRTLSQRATQPPEGWTPEHAEQLAADFLAELQAATTDAQRNEIAGRIGDAVKALKITAQDRTTLLAAYNGRQPATAGAQS